MRSPFNYQKPCTAKGEWNSRLSLEKPSGIRYAESERRAAICAGCKAVYDCVRVALMSSDTELTKSNPDVRDVIAEGVGVLEPTPFLATKINKKTNGCQTYAFGVEVVIGKTEEGDEYGGAKRADHFSIAS